VSVQWLGITVKLGDLTLRIPPATTRVPQVEVTLIFVQMVFLQVSAKDKATGNPIIYG